MFCQATDKDSTDIVFTLLSGNTPDNAFSLNPISGELILTRPLRFQETPEGAGE